MRLCFRAAILLLEAITQVTILDSELKQSIAPLKNFWKSANDIFEGEMIRI